jgi:predicted metallo-beta-lactamase superfamily hydrolase
MRACFGSLDVAPRRVNAPGVPREEKAMKEKTKNLAKRAEKGRVVTRR